MLLMAGQAGVPCPQVEALAQLDDGSMVLAMERVDGTAARRARRRARSMPSSSTRSWQEVAALHRARHRAPGLARRQHPRRRRAARASSTWTSPRSRRRRGCRPSTEPSCSLRWPRSPAPSASVASAARVLGAGRPGRAPRRSCSRSRSRRATRKQASKAMLGDLRTEIAAVTGEEPLAARAAHPRRPRTLLMITVSVGAFYLLLPATRQRRRQLHRLAARELAGGSRSAS